VMPGSVTGAAPPEIAMCISPHIKLTDGPGAPAKRETVRGPAPW
jgi:hypothetical protein